MSQITRIMSDSFLECTDNFLVYVDNCCLSDFETFMLRFGNAISNEIIAHIYGNMHANVGAESRASHYRIEIKIEKSNEFYSCRGEYIG